MKYIKLYDCKIIMHYLGKVMQATGVAFLVPIIVAIIYNELNCILGFVLVSGFSLILGTIFNKIPINSSHMRLKHGMIISSLAWLWASILGSLLMFIVLKLPIIDGLFENMSMWTGTGLSLFTNVEALPKSILFLRSFEGWLGGLGIVIIAIGILIRSGTAASKLYKSEAREERIKPSIVNTMNKTIEIYLIYTVFGIVLYLLAGMPLFDSVNLCFSMICTGGMSIKNQNIGFYHNNIIYIISMLIMIIGSISFPVHYKLYFTRGKSLIRDVQFRTMILLIVISSLVIFGLTRIFNIDLLFTLISTITTTGANTVQPNVMMSWARTDILIILLLMIIGGSSGSTVGGVKIIRVLTVAKSLKRTVEGILSPEGRKFSLKIEGKEITDKDTREAGSYIILYLVILFLSWIVLIGHGFSDFNTLFDVASAISNNGLSSSFTNPTLPYLVKLVLIFDMWVGRLEIIPILVSFYGLYDLIRIDRKRRKKTKS